MAGDPERERAPGQLPEPVPEDVGRIPDRVEQLLRHRQEVGSRAADDQRCACGSGEEQRDRRRQGGPFTACRRSRRGRAP